MSHYKIFIDSARWECSPNLIICSNLYQYFFANGHTVIQEPTESDYIIVNSCGVTDRGKNRTLNIVRKYIGIKKDHTTIILFGCLKDIDRKIADDLDVIAIGLKDNKLLDNIFYKKIRFEEIRPFCNDELRKKLVQGKHSTAVKPTDDPIKISLLELHPFLLSFPLILFFSKVRKRYLRIKNRYSNNIYVEISKGCTGNCNYCLVRKAKGKVHSRSISDILKDIEMLYDPLKELQLVADDCGCYGVDKGLTIIELLDAIHEKFPNLRLKINYIDPGYLLKYSEDFFRLFKTINISSTMIPLQSGSQKVLNKMNRNYDIKKVIEVIKKIRNISPETFIVSHFILGHPGETWSDYRMTLSAARYFDYPAPFEYSKNKDTVSAEMPDYVSRWICFLRYVFFIIYLNIVVFFRLVDSSNTKKIL
jgi:tRNA A37 methylthiotransferase MiaB